MTCTECGGALDPDVTHTAHWWGRWDCLDGGCDCPEVCAACCQDPDCPLRDTQEIAARATPDVTPSAEHQIPVVVEQVEYPIPGARDRATPGAETGEET